MDTINKFKSIEQAKEILADPQQYDKDILDVAFESGFYEVSRFNEAFREATNMCPVEYRAFHTQFKLVTGMSPAEYHQTAKAS